MLPLAVGIPRWLTGSNQINVDLYAKDFLTFQRFGLEALRNSANAIIA